MKIETLNDLYINELLDMHNAEKQLTKALPKIAKASASDELREAVEDHLAQTQTHVERLETILAGLDKKPGRVKCEAMEGLIEEGTEMLEADADDEVRDSGLIIAAQKVEHYEIAGYGSLRALAALLGRSKDADLLEQTLEEEKQADATLTRIATSVVNRNAMEH